MGLKEQYYNTKDVVWYIHMIYLHSVSRSLQYLIREPHSGFCGKFKIGEPLNYVCLSEVQKLFFAMNYSLQKTMPSVETNIYVK